MKPGDGDSGLLDTPTGMWRGKRAGWHAVILVGLLGALLLCVVIPGAGVPTVDAETEASVPTGEYASNSENASAGADSSDRDGPTCNRCHDVLEPNPRERQLENEVANQPDHGFEFDHGSAMWCLDCHAREDRNQLRISNGSVMDWTSQTEIQQCGSCHGPVYRDWRAGIHGSWNGSWADPAPADTCTDCHDPHDPGSMAIQPEPAPQKPPSGPEVARAVLPGGYYVAVGFLGAIATGLIGYAGLALRRDNDG